MTDNKLWRDRPPVYQLYSCIGFPVPGQRRPRPLPGYFTEYKTSRRKCQANQAAEPLFVAEAGVYSGNGPKSGGGIRRWEADS